MKEQESLFHKDAVVFMMRDGKLICNICGAELNGTNSPDDCPVCNPLGITFIND